MIRSLFRRTKRYSCAQVLEVLQAHIDGEVTDDVALAVSQHLDRCERCPNEVAIFRRIQRSLATQSVAIEPEIIERLNAYAAALPESVELDARPDDRGPSNN